MFLSFLEDWDNVGFLPRYWGHTRYKILLVQIKGPTKRHINIIKHKVIDRRYKGKAVSFPLPFSSVLLLTVYNCKLLLTAEHTLLILI
jgi:hypothetical protein